MRSLELLLADQWLRVAALHGMQDGSQSLMCKRVMQENWYLFFVRTVSTCGVSSSESCAAARSCQTTSLMQRLQQMAPGLLWLGHTICPSGTSVVPTLRPRHHVLQQRRCEGHSCGADHLHDLIRIGLSACYPSESCLVSRRNACHTSMHSCIETWTLSVTGHSCLLYTSDAADE